MVLHFCRSVPCPVCQSTYREVEDTNRRRDAADQLAREGQDMRLDEPDAAMQRARIEQLTEDLAWQTAETDKLRGKVGYWRHLWERGNGYQDELTAELREVRAELSTLRAGWATERPIYEGDDEVWIPPSTDCMDFGAPPCPHCGVSRLHHRTGRCGDCGRRPAPIDGLLTSPKRPENFDIEED